MFVSFMVEYGQLGTTQGISAAESFPQPSVVRTHQVSRNRVTSTKARDRLLGLGESPSRPFVDYFCNTGFQHEVQPGSPFKIRSHIQQGST
jgi:hypothetical protein